MVVITIGISYPLVLARSRNHNASSKHLKMFFVMRPNPGCVIPYYVAPRARVHASSLNVFAAAARFTEAEALTHTKLCNVFSHLNLTTP